MVDSKTIIESRPFIAGKWFDGEASHWLTKSCPVTGGAGISVNESGAGIVDMAVHSARDTFESVWRDMPLAKRKDILLAVADAVSANGEEIAQLDSQEMGKPISAAREDAWVAAAFFRYYAEAIDKNYGVTSPSDAGAMEKQVRIPKGVIGAITPWNFPAINAALKSAPALAAGNCIVIKPSQVATLSTLRIAEIATAAGLPTGVMNVVPGSRETATPLITHPSVDLITFTGSTPTGAKVMQMTAHNGLKPVLLECGGKNPSVVFADILNNVSAEALAEALVAAALWNSGQVCVARSRVYIERDAYEAIAEAVVKSCTAVKIGLSENEETSFGPLACQSQYDQVLSAIEQGVRSGVEVLLDGRQCEMPEGGFYVGPTVFGDVNQDNALAQEEIFGPVISLTPFDDEAEALRFANDSQYGLAASLYTADFARAHRFAERIEAGKVSVYARPSQIKPCWQAHAAEPLKQSGFGIEGGLAGLASYSTLKSIQYIYG